MLKRGLVVVLALVVFCAAQHATADVDLILIVKTERHLNGVPETDPYGASIMVTGSGITSVSVEEPNGADYALEDLGGGQWGMGEEFAGEAARDAAFGSGSYDFSFNGGADTVTVSHTQAVPGTFANITFPDHQETGVGPNPTCEWDSMVGAGDGLALFLRKDPDGIDEDVFEEWPVDINTISRQIGPLDPATEYKFEVTVGNMEGDDVQDLQTVQGDDFQYLGVASNFNAVIFETAPMPDIEAILIEQFKDYEDGIAITNPWGIEIDIEGTDITSATVTPPGGAPIALEDGGDGEWEIEAQYASLAALNTAWPTGDYDFTFNNGFDTVTLSYAAPAPSGFAPITYPAHQQADVETNPEYTWTSAAGLGEALGMYVVQNPEGMGFDLYEDWNVDIDQTSWQPGSLPIGEDYEFELAVFNSSPGTPAMPSTDGGDTFGYSATFEFINIIGFSVPAAVMDVTSININQIKRHVDGTEVTPDPCIVDISVAGDGITDVSVQVPNSDVHVLVYDALADRWSHGESFASIAAMLAAYGTGEYLFTLNGGDDTVTLDFDAAEPGGFAVITYPDHLQNDVEQEPTFTWNSVAGDGSFLNMWVTMDGAQVYGNWGADINLVSWQPGALLTDQDYEFGLAVFNGTAQATATDGGDPFNYSGTLEYINRIEFHVPGSGPLADIDSIWIDRCKDYVNNAEDSWFMEVYVEGVDITSGTVTPPGGTPIALEDWGDGEWGIEDEYDTLSNLNDEFPTGLYAFSFNGGDDTVTIDYGVAEPTGYAHITYPAHQQKGVPLDPTLEWNSADGFGAHLGMWVIEDPDGLDEDVDHNHISDMTTVSWQPDTLEIETEYAFELSVLNFHGGAPQLEQTDGFDDFSYYGVFEYCNWVEFSTDPDISIISLLKELTHENGVEDPNPYIMEVWVQGVNITSATVTPPDGAPIALEDWGDGEWGVDPEYASLAALNTAWPSGSYDFDFNSSFDTVTVSHNEDTAPAGFAPIMSPTHGQTGVGTDPAFEWGSVTGLGDLLAADIIKDPEGLDEDFYQELIFDTSTTSCDPDPLDLGFEYEFGVAVVNLEGGDAPELVTDGGDAFQYVGAFVNHNRIAFETAPMVPEDDFSVDVTRIYYQDGSGREIDYDFSAGSIDVDGTITIPDSAVLQRAPGEAGTTFLWEPVYGDVQSELGAGFCRMSIPQADIFSAPSIPSADIVVDGSPDDWLAIQPYVQDDNTSEDDVSQAGSDVEYVKLAYSTDGTRLNILMKVTDAISQELFYRMFFARDTEHIGPGDYQVDFLHLGGGWDVASQGWDSEGDWYPIDEDGLAAASGAFIEGSFDVAALGLESEFYVFGRTMQSEAPYAHYDYFGASEFEQEGGCAIGALDAAAPASENCTFEVTVANFCNVTRENYYFDICAGLGSSEPDIEPEIWATWFTGTLEGTYYENALVLGAEVSDEVTWQDWENDPIIVEGLDPSTTTLDLKAQVENGVTFTASYRINAGEWQSLWQHTIADGQMLGFPEMFPYVDLETGFEGGEPMPDITDILIIKNEKHIDGVNPPDPYDVNIIVFGSNITEVSVEEPNGASYALTDQGNNQWGLEADFASAAARDAAFGSGEYDFIFNEGADTVTVSHTQTAPGVFPNITSPDHQQTGVGPNPTCEWDSMAGNGDGLALFLRKDPDGINEDTWQAWPVDIGTMSQQIGPLDSATEYQFEVDLVNLEGDNVQGLQTDQGDDFQYAGVAANTNAVTFETAPMPDIEDIFIARVREFENGIEITNPWVFEVDIEGTDITGGTVTSPGTAGQIALENSGWWGFEQGFASQAALEAAFSTGDYVFSINGGFATVTINYDVSAPTGFADVIDPEDGDHNVGQNPTITWDSVDGLGEAIIAFLIEDPDGASEDIDEFFTLVMTTTSWAPDPLADQTEFEIEISVANLDDGGLVAMQTDQGDDFTYEGWYDFCNVVCFDTLHWRVTGDATNDCKVDILDMLHVRNHLGADVDTDDNWWIDVTEDGNINILDMLHVRDHLNDACPE